MTPRPKRRSTDNVPSATDGVRFYVKAVLAVVAFEVVASMVAAVVLPENTALADRITDLGTPVIAGLMALAAKNFATAVDGRMDSLVTSTANQHRLAGFVEGVIDPTTPPSTIENPRAVNPVGPVKPLDSPP